MTQVPLPSHQWPDARDLITEDDIPVDNLPSEKQQRLLTETLYSSWTGPGNGRSFLVAANVGLFYSVHQPPLVPDVFLSLDVEVAEDWWDKNHRSYFFWEFGKPPEVAIEIVSNTKGNEAGSKLTDYARMRVTYYGIFDPLQQLQGSILRLYALQRGQYVEISDPWLESVGLGLRLWEGTYEGKTTVWLRWCDSEGRVIPTGAERAEGERQRAERAEHRAAQLAERLRSLGIDPDQAI
jgi:Uma2 family endonuclease